MFLFRHRAINLFLQGYDKSWIETEEHYFEDKLIEDLAVRLGERVVGMYYGLTFILYSNNYKSVKYLRYHLSYLPKGMS